MVSSPPRTPRVVNPLLADSARSATLQDKFVNRFSKASGSSSSAANALDTEQYGYALPLGRGIEKMPMPEFSMPSLLDVSVM